MNLSDKFAIVRLQILSMDPLPRNSKASNVIATHNFRLTTYLYSFILKNLKENHYFIFIFDLAKSPVQLMYQDLIYLTIIILLFCVSYGISIIKFINANHNHRIY